MVRRRALPPRVTHPGMCWPMVCALALLAVACAAPSRPAATVSQVRRTAVADAIREPARVEELSVTGPVPNGLPLELGVLARSEVLSLAFANDAAMRMGKLAHAAGAVEDASGVTICLVSGPPSVMGGSIIPHPLPFAASSTRMCVREIGAHIELKPGARLEETVWGMGFVLALRRSDGALRRRVYVFGDDAVVYDAALAEPSLRASRERLGKPPPWVRSVKLARRQELRGRRKHGLFRMADAVLDGGVKLVPAPAWVEVLERNSELATRPLVTSDHVVLALTLGNACEIDGEPAREVVIAERAPGRWLGTVTRSEEIIEAVRAPTLQDDALLVLARERLLRPGFPAGTPRADTVKLQILVPAATGLESRGQLTLGENGRVRIGTKERVWRVFHQARVVAPRCVEIVRDHAWTAWVDRRTRHLSDSRRLALGLEGLPPHLPGAYAQLSGRYAWRDGSLVREPCP